MCKRVLSLAAAAFACGLVFLAPAIGADYQTPRPRAVYTPPPPPPPVYEQPAYYPPPPPVQTSCCCPTVKRGIVWNFGCGARSYVQYPQVPAYQPYPAYQRYPAAMPHHQVLQYQYQPQYPYPAHPAGYYGPGVGVGVGIGPVGIGIGTRVTHRRAHHRNCWRNNRGRWVCR